VSDRNKSSYEEGRTIMIGILAGMGPKSTGPFVDKVVDECRKIYDELFLCYASESALISFWLSFLFYHFINRIIIFKPAACGGLKYDNSINEMIK
jgi:hypothetical protein